jgi:hypothetical protein
MTINSPAAREAPGTTAGKRRLHPLHVHISVLFTLLILVSGSIIGWHNYRQNSKVMLSAADDLFERIGRETVLEIGRIYAPIELLTDFVSKQQITEDSSLAQRLQRLPAMAQAIKQNSAMSAIYVGYDSGDFFLLRPLPLDAVERKNLNAPANAAYLVQSADRLEKGPMRSRFVYLNEALQPLQTIERPDYTFDPRQREWYKLATKADHQIKTAPYVFFTTRDTGITFARRGRAAVVGTDVTLTQISDLLRMGPFSRRSALCTR